MPSDGANCRTAVKEYVRDNCSGRIGTRGNLYLHPELQRIQIRSRSQECEYFGYIQVASGELEPYDNLVYIELVNNDTETRVFVFPRERVEHWGRRRKSDKPGYLRIGLRDDWRSDPEVRRG